ncbi:acetyl-CoA carboxylase carboxyl transferase subunit beta, partial [bacterium AH-315-I11]|nr:acetyl-CoA carboxylase carboxyl transferase subunit beta [bacterium AH-315-I11]
MSWINKILPSKIKTDTDVRNRNIPEGLWKKCPRCDAVLYSSNLDENKDICPKCDHHLRISARRRLD